MMEYGELHEKIDKLYAALRETTTVSDTVDLPEGFESSFREGMIVLQAEQTQLADVSTSIYTLLRYTDGLSYEVFTGSEAVEVAPGQDVREAFDRKHEFCSKLTSTLGKLAVYALRDAVITMDTAFLNLLDSHYGDDDED
ncbi:hypothetical protein ACRQFN_02230 [Actinotignum sp. GS-2025e]|uniref:hypothetical protein n=1 Tax=unclassified Actinotignum TaxID=2632702 RepID=UPI003F486883